MKNSIAWSWHLIAGVALALLLGMHMTIMHLDDVLVLLGWGAGKAVDYTAVAERGRQVFFLITYVLLLAAALYHGLYGLRTILFELTLKPAVEKTLTVVFVLVGLLLLLYGTLSAVSAFQTI